MRSRTTALLTTISIGAFLYNWLFNGADLGINLVIFTSFLSISLFLFSKTPDNEARNLRTTTSFALVCLVISAVAVLRHATGLSILALVCAMLVLAGFVHGVKLRQPTLALLGAISNLLIAPFEFSRETAPAAPEIEISSSRYRWKKAMMYMRISIIPLVVTLVFYALYVSANSVFLEQTVAMLESVREFFDKVLHMSWRSFGLCILGALFTAAVLIGSWMNNFAKLEEPFGDKMERQKNTGRYHIPTMALKFESRSGVILLVMLNFLLLLFHLVDIPSVWGKFEVEPLRYSAEVHQGVYTMIFCVLLSALVLLYYFRSNQHFYKNNVWLRRLSYLWLLQNVLLLVSVAIRDYWYIFNLGLSYKRIGVIIYLLMTLAGLLTLGWKIAKDRSTFYLFRVNSWFVLFLLCTNAAINWDLVIARNNLSYKNGEIDYRYLTTLSDRTLPAFHEHLHELPDEFRKEILARGEQWLIDEADSKDWRSWNLADHKLAKAIQPYYE